MNRKLIDSDMPRYWHLQCFSYAYITSAFITILWRGSYKNFFKQTYVFVWNNSLLQYKSIERHKYDRLARMTHIHKNKYIHNKAELYILNMNWGHLQIDVLSIEYACATIIAEMINPNTELLNNWYVYLYWAKEIIWIKSLSNKPRVYHCDTRSGILILICTQTC